ncbi:MAG: alanyl-tRNA editing protein [Actinomycetota bacterium]|nr:alanyl-tRNA editing protein [Actinomycetota bacterium]
MAVYLCHEEPELLGYEATVVAARPGAVVLDRSAFHPGGGGQVSDAGAIEASAGRYAVTGISQETDEHGDAVWWHLLDDAEAEPSGQVMVEIDAGRRSLVSQLHTDSHLLNAFVYEQFEGALVTGAQINADGTGRMDFDLQDVDNDVLRGLDAPVNGVIADGVTVASVYVDAVDAASTDGLVRSMSVAPPPTPDGRMRVIDIVGIDRQACGGTHLANTGQSLPFVITKVENKGRRNRRVRFRLDRPS